MAGKSRGTWFVPDTNDEVLGKAVEEVTAVIKGIAQKKHIALDVEVAADLENVTLDQHKFKQVLYNLLSNAVKFTDDGGRVAIQTR